MADHALPMLPNWQVPIACALPTLQREHEWAQGVHPFFQHLGPEGWLREKQARTAHIAEEDDFGLLLRYGADCIGAVGVCRLANGKGKDVEPAAEVTTSPGRTVSGVRPLGDAAHCDFWRAAPTGRAFTIRGYQEDGQETFPPRTIFDTTLPTWRIGEALLHAEALAEQLAENKDKTDVRLRVLYTGLSGRVLRAWGNPMSDLMFEGSGARSDEAMLETVVPVREIKSNLAKVLHPLIASLFERFGATGLSVDRVEEEIEKMKKNNFRSVRN
jgi:HipA-like protein